MTRGLARGLLLAVTVLAACSDAPTAPTATLPPRHLDLAEQWIRAEPAAAGLDPGVLTAALQHAGSLDFLRSLVIVRNGYLVHEQYFGGHGPDSLADVRSVTKSVLATLVGIALQDGTFSGVDQRVAELLPDLLEPPARAITIRHLLTMTSGYDWSEGDAAGYNDWIVADDHVRYLTRRPLREAPGTRFNYNSAAVHLLGVLLAEAADLPVPTFARDRLFEPLGIDRVRWEPLSNGYVNGGSGLGLRPRDLARLGQLYLQQGASGVRQIVRQEWILDATTPRFSSFGSSPPSEALNYGYLWWIEQASPEAFFAWGHGGQFLYVVPSLRLVVVVTTSWRGAADPSEQGRQALRLITEHIVPAASF